MIIYADQDLVWHNLFACFTKIVSHGISNLVVLSQSGSHYIVKVYSICLVQCRIKPKNDTRYTCVNTSRMYTHTHTHLRFRPSVDLQAGVCTDSGSWAKSCVCPKTFAMNHVEQLREQTREASKIFD